jgi:hypothetical protein
MMYFLQTVPHWYEIGASIATMVGALGVLFLFGQHYYNKDVRNLQLMHRCIDNFRNWSEEYHQEINFFYLELFNEELFYFQQNLIVKKVALEWIEGILDYIQVYAEDGAILTNYNKQTNIEALSIWQNKEGFFARIHFFIYPPLDKSFGIPEFNEENHASKKRELAKALYRHIKNYKY